MFKFAGQLRHRFQDTTSIKSISDLENGGCGSLCTCELHAAFWNTEVITLDGNKIDNERALTFFISRDGNRTSENLYERHKVYL